MSADLAAGSAPHVGPYDGSDLRKLQSLPGADRVVYIDTSRIFNGDAPVRLSKEEFWQAWQTASAAYSMYKVNFTTDPEVYAANGMTNSGRVCIAPEDGRASCGLNSFGTARCCNNYMKTTGRDLGRSIAHEVGHMMGLLHDGTSAAEYYRGITAFKWVPIMGNYPSSIPWGTEALVQWSKGEYADANRQEDDLAVINKHLAFRDDDVPQSTPLVIHDDGTVSANDNTGQIALNSDSDTFTFAVGAGGGHVTLAIDRTEFYASSMLDVAAEILNAADAKVSESNEKVARGARFDLDLPAGNYRLVVKGGAEGTPTNGFSSYSSLGFYAIAGKIANGLAPAPSDGGVLPDSAVAGDGRASADAIEDRSRDAAGGSERPQGTGGTGGSAKPMALDAAAGGGTGGSSDAGFAVGLDGLPAVPRPGTGDPVAGGCACDLVDRQAGLPARTLEMGWLGLAGALAITRRRRNRSSQ